VENETNDFRTLNLPPNYKEEPAKKEYEKLLSETVKAKKANLSSILKAGLTDAQPPMAVPTLYKCIGNVYATLHPNFKGKGHEAIHADTRITSGAKIQMAYLRFIVNLNRLGNRDRPKGVKEKSHWDDADEILNDLRKQDITSIRDRLQPDYLRHQSTDLERPEHCCRCS
jgi:hypothetical protein